MKGSTLPANDATDGINYDTQSITSNVYNQSAIGEMNFDELNQLLIKNHKRVEEFEKKFVQAKKEIYSYKEINNMIKDADSWIVKEKYKDCSTKYPSYGRGLTPNMQMNTFMV